MRLWKKHCGPLSGTVTREKAGSYTGIAGLAECTLPLLLGSGSVSGRSLWHGGGHLAERGAEGPRRWADE